MEESHEQDTAGINQSGLGRRRFLLKAGAAGAVAWAVPSIITMQPAGAAELTSPPPQPPAVEVLPNVVTHGAEPEEVLPARTGLPRTGAEIGNLTAAGLAAVAGGAALHVWSAKRPDSFAGPDAEAPPAPPLP